MTSFWHSWQLLFIWAGYKYLVSFHFISYNSVMLEKKFHFSRVGPFFPEFSRENFFPWFFQVFQSLYQPGTMSHAMGNRAYHIWPKNNFFEIINVGVAIYPPFMPLRPKISRIFDLVELSRWHRATPFFTGNSIGRPDIKIISRLLKVVETCSWAQTNRNMQVYLCCYNIPKL